MLTTLNFKRAQKHAKILGTKVGDASGPSNLKNSTFTFIVIVHSSYSDHSRHYILVVGTLAIPDI